MARSRPAVRGAFDERPLIPANLPQRPPAPWHGVIVSPTGHGAGGGKPERVAPCRKVREIDDLGGWPVVIRWPVGNGGAEHHPSEARVPCH